MTTILLGMGLLLLTLAGFSLFSMKAPKGSQAMSGLANAAVATFLVEAIHKYISGNLIGIDFLGEVGSMSGSMGGVAAAILVPIGMGANPIFAVVTGVAVGGYGILPGFVAGYLVGFLSPLIEKYLPAGLDVILGALMLAPIARLVAFAADPVVNAAMGYIGTMITAATEQSPLLMGFLLGGIIKMICTSPLSSMALTAMLGLTGLPMGIAAIACFGGSFTNGLIFARLHLGDRSNIIAVMLEPLTQAPIITSNPIPIYGSNFFGGGLAGIAAAMLGIVNNAPGTASPIPGLLAPFAFNEPQTVVLALVLAALGGSLAGFVGSIVFKRFQKGASETDAPENSIISLVEDIPV
ncbi:MAG: PTS sugar transporter subunit IIC [Clostridiales bacterium]|nr:PTS sugar transporter subunit IIC [Clostridiales bacterium]